MKFEIIVRELIPHPDGHSRSTEIYTQKVRQLDLPALIKAINTTFAKPPEYSDPEFGE